MNTKELINKRQFELTKFLYYQKIFSQTKLKIYLDCDEYLNENYENVKNGIIDLYKNFSGNEIEIIYKANSSNFSQSIISMLTEEIMQIIQIVTLKLEIYFDGFIDNRFFNLDKRVFKRISLYIIDVYKFSNEVYNKFRYLCNKMVINVDIVDLLIHRQRYNEMFEYNYISEILEVNILNDYLIDDNIIKELMNDCDRIHMEYKKLNNEYCNLICSACYPNEFHIGKGLLSKCHCFVDFYNCIGEINNKGLSIDVEKYLEWVMLPDLINIEDKCKECKCFSACIGRHCRAYNKDKVLTVKCIKEAIY